MFDSRPHENETYKPAALLSELPCVFNSYLDPARKGSWHRTDLSVLADQVHYD